MESLSGGRLSGGQESSSSIVLELGALRCGDYESNTGTAGSCTLLAQACWHHCLLAASTPCSCWYLLSNQPPAHVQQIILCPTCSASAQAALPCLLFASPTGGRDISTLDLRGGTDAAFAPPVGYMQHILLPTLRRLLDIDVTDKVSRHLMRQVIRSYQTITAF